MTPDLGDNAPEIVFSILSALVIVLIVFDSALRPPASSAQVASMANGASVSSAGTTNTSSSRANPCPRPVDTPCQHYLYRPEYDACEPIQLAPGTPCKSPCHVVNATSAKCNAEGQCVVTQPAESRGHCVSVDDCHIPLPPDATRACILGQCQAQFVQPYLRTDPATHRVTVLDAASPCLMALDDSYRRTFAACLTETQWLVAMDLTNNRDSLTQYRICHIVFST